MRICQLWRVVGLFSDRRLGTDRPPGFPFNLSSAVDKLLKTEFDTHRAAGPTPKPSTRRSPRKITAR